MFACGLEGSEPDRVEAVEALILEVLERVAREGVEQELVESVLHQLELSQREIGGDHFPYGLQLMVAALPPALHGGDPAAQLNLDPALDELRQSIQDPDFIKGLARRWLVDNPHRVTVVFKPDTQLSNQRAQAEAERLAQIKAGLDETQRQAVIAKSAALEQRQSQQDDLSILPKVTLDDVPAQLRIPEWREGQLGNAPLTQFSQGTNGLIYEQLIIDLPQMSSELFDLLPLFTLCLTEVGSGGRDYLATQALQAKISGGVSASVSLRGGVSDPHQTRGLFVLSGKALARNQGPLTDLLWETFESARFDELERLRELVAQTRMQAEQGVTDNGHGLAMLAASCGLAPSAQITHHWRGLAGLKRLKALDKALNDPEQLRLFAEQLGEIRQQLHRGSHQFLTVAEEAQLDPLAQAMEQRWGALNQGDSRLARGAFSPQPIQQAWLTSTQVNFCARAYRGAPAAHADAAPLMVLAAFLRNGYLHRAIREQGGAYGGGATYDGDSGAFRFFSYRDPRLGATLSDFDRAIDWMLAGNHESRTLEEAILSIISRIDQPGSPAGEAKSTFHNNLHGRTPEHRRQLRERVLGVKVEDLQRVTETYLAQGEAHNAVICSHEAQARESELGLESCPL